MPQSGLRNRRNNPKHKPKRSKGNENGNSGEATSAAASTALPEDGDETMWQTFVSHPLVKLAPIIIVPYAAYLFYYFLSLKRPDVIGTATFGLTSLRPATSLDDPRQVLIVGSMGSGTKQVSEALVQVLKLELGLEATNAETLFCRDGTVSSLLGIRFTSNTEISNNSARTITDICLDEGKQAGKALVPENFRPTVCSRFHGWTSCHSRECLHLLSGEWGCELTDTCRIRFRRVLHIVQHPLQMIAELMARVCPGKAKTAHPAFQQLATVFFDKMNADPCLQGISWYVIRFNNALLQARKLGKVAAMVRYESTSVCEIAQLAGFSDPLQVYPPNERKFTFACGPNGTNADAMKPVPALATKTDSTRSLPNYTWDDYRDAGGPELAKELRQLCVDLGYDPDQVN